MGELIYEDAMSHELLHSVIEEVVQHGQQPVLFTSPASEVELLSGPPENDNLVTARYLAGHARVRRLAYRDLGATDHVVSIGVLQENDVLRPLHDRLSRWSTCEALLWEPDPMYEGGVDYLIDIVNAGSSKSKAVAHLAASYGISMDQVMAIGDQVNDLQLIEGVGLGIAMGNAIPAVQQRAKVVVGTNDDDGVVEALYRFVLDEEAVA